MELGENGRRCGYEREKEIERVGVSQRDDREPTRNDSMWAVEPLSQPKLPKAHQAHVLRRLGPVWANHHMRTRVHYRPNIIWARLGHVIL